MKTILVLAALTIGSAQASASDLIFGCDKSSAAGTLTAVAVLHDNGEADYWIDLNPVFHLNGIYNQSTIQDGNAFTDGMVFAAADNDKNVMLVTFPGVHSFAKPGLISGGHGAIIQKNGSTKLDEQGLDCNVLIK